MIKDLILNVDSLEEGQEPFEADLPREFLDETLRTDPPTEFTAHGASHLRGRVTKMGQNVLVQGRFTMPLAGQCKRCLKPVTLDEQVEVTREYVRSPEDRKSERRKDDDEGETAGSFDAELVDQEVYDGHQIDLRPALREQILLSVPPSPVCREDCKGLCPKCGKDLNEGDCGCDRTVMDPRWAALKGIQLEKKEK